MKMIKRIASISAFVAMPFMWGGLEDLFRLRAGNETNCYNALRGNRNPDEFRIFIRSNYYFIEQTRDDQLRQRYLKETNPEIKRIVEWELNRRHIPLQNTAAPVAPAVPAPQAAHRTGDADLEEAIRLSLLTLEDEQNLQSALVISELDQAKADGGTTGRASVEEVVAKLSNTGTPPDEAVKLLRDYSNELSSANLQQVVKTNPGLEGLNAFNEVLTEVVLRETAAQQAVHFSIEEVVAKLSNTGTPPDEAARLLRDYSNELSSANLQQVLKANSTLGGLKAFNEVLGEVLLRETGAQKPVDSTVRREAVPAAGDMAATSSAMAEPTPIDPLQVMLESFRGSDGTPTWSKFWEEFVKRFPLNTFFEESCDFRSFNNLIRSAGQVYAIKGTPVTRDVDSLDPVLKTFLENNDFEVITTPGTGNCAFAAPILSLFSQCGGYMKPSEAEGRAGAELNDYYDLAFGKYLDAAIKPFREEVAKKAKELGFGEQLTAFIEKLNEPVYATVFRPIAKTLGFPVILFSLTQDKRVSCALYNKDGVVTSVISLEGAMDRNPDAIFVCHVEGKGHFAALRNPGFMRQKLLVRLLNDVQSNSNENLVRALLGVWGNCSEAQKRRAADMAFGEGGLGRASDMIQRINAQRRQSQVDQAASSSAK